MLTGNAARGNLVLHLLPPPDPPPHQRLCLFIYIQPDHVEKPQGWNSNKPGF